MGFGPMGETAGGNTCHHAIDASLHAPQQVLAISGGKFQFAEAALQQLVEQGHVLTFQVEELFTVGRVQAFLEGGAVAQQAELGLQRVGQQLFEGATNHMTHGFARRCLVRGLAQLAQMLARAVKHQARVERLLAGKVLVHRTLADAGVTRHFGNGDAIPGLFLK